MAASETVYRAIAEQDLVFRSDCASRPILDQIADKWSMMVMAVLAEPRRFSCPAPQSPG
jgi:DNA-binding HxlR family transcriptional regulator